LPPVPRVPRVLALLALAVCVVALGACGGAADRKAKNDYVRQVNAAQNEFAANVSTVSQRITDKSSSKADRKTLEQFQAAIDGVVSDLRDIKVPGDVTSEHAQLVGAMSGFGAKIRSAVSALRNPTQQNIADARQTIATATQTVNVRIDAAIAAINSKLSRK
jgi:pyruvate/2-oxoglutarate dehydrogenase complex dihydrolipoamide acyltransferase (E2) component